jgi:hypothetical protein
MPSQRALECEAHGPRDSPAVPCQGLLQPLVLHPAATGLELQTEKRVSNAPKLTSISPKGGGCEMQVQKARLASDQCGMSVAVCV